MGSGRFPGEGYGRAAYFRNVQVVDWDNNLIPTAGLRLVADHPSCYDIAGGQGGDWGKSAAKKLGDVRPPGGGEASGGEVGRHGEAWSRRPRSGEACGDQEAAKGREATGWRERGRQRRAVGKNLGGWAGEKIGRTLLILGKKSSSVS
ncbi:hypothetical protein GUJ93_ZPchr0003g17210 [Zizania palustris]|uniref:Neprosin PEP catalytic domain-containing protein n=1 Tax=Zizania palustris TaxID=103762 RepID=A0A8J5RW95_ZIZPA|nr:hypothetical protein GUJ93_ZPchr0003g17210 [Zizania palustris]